MAETDFLVGIHKFSDLEIHDTEHKGFFFFYDKRRRTLVKRFVLAKREQVTCECRVTLIEKEGRFTPRLEFSIRDNKRRIIKLPDNNKAADQCIKARVDLQDCHEPLWKLLNYIGTLPGIEIPRAAFSLVSQEEKEIVEALSKRGAESVKSIIRQLSSSSGLTLSHQDINELLKRKDRLREFENGLSAAYKEVWWQDFFEENKWIFGYGLNYQILRSVQNQPTYGGTRLDGTGTQRGDYLTATAGDLSFTVLVEIKTPGTQLVQGKAEIRADTWSLSIELVDAVAQLQTNLDRWNVEGARLPDNVKRLWEERIHTIQPKGILVIGLGRELDKPSKHRTFQRFRSSIRGIDILTFDELYQRASFIVEHKEY